MLTVDPLHHSVQGERIRELIEETLNLTSASRAPSTIRAYESHWGSFEAFCTEHTFVPLPTDPRTVAVYLTSLVRRDMATGTIQSHLAAIKYFHERERIPFDADNPLIAETMAGIRRTVGTAQQGSAALLPEDLRAMVTCCTDNLSGIRDRAIVLLGFAGAFRRSELVGLAVEDLTFCEQGLVVRIKRSKTDQNAQGRDVAIPFGAIPDTCPVTALFAWLEASSIRNGHVFRGVDRHGNIRTTALTGEAVRQIVAKLVESSGLEGKITPHSLRAGFCTAAALAGAGLDRIKDHARHQNVATTLKYVRVADQWNKHAGTGLL